MIAPVIVLALLTALIATDPDRASDEGGRP